MGMGKEKKVVPAIVFVTKCPKEVNDKDEFEKYNKFLDENQEFLKPQEVEPPKGCHFSKCKYYYDKKAERLVLVLKSTNRSPILPSDLGLEIKAFEETRDEACEKALKAFNAAEAEFLGVRDVVTEVIKKIFKCLENADIRFSGEVVFLRHFGDGGARGNIYKQELILQKWAKGRDNFKNWDFFLISSVRPEMLDLNNREKVVIPIGDQLAKFVKKLKDGVFNVRTLQDIQSAEFLKRWRNFGWKTEAKAVFCIVTEFAGPDGSKVKDFLGMLPDDEKFNASPVPLFIVTQYGVRYSNWEEWSFETSFVQVLQNFKQANGNLDQVCVYQLFKKDDLLDGFGQIACDEFSGCRDFCYRAFYLNDSLSRDADDSDSETVKGKLKEAMGTREGRVAAVVRFLTGEEGLHSDETAGKEGVKKTYQQVMRELGH